MAITHKALSLSGVDLNFKIIGGIAAPANPKENTIWVNTEIKINKWSIDGKEPTSPIDGQVWIKTLNSGGRISFNAVKDNTINICLDKVYIWSANGWSEAEVMIYHNGEFI